MEINNSNYSPENTRPKITPMIKNETDGDNKTLILSGTVIKDYFNGEIPVINAKVVREALEGTKGNITIKLNSGGGDVFEGVEIYNYLKTLENHITIEVTGLAGSAASIICMGGDDVVMHTGTSMMIHNASCYAAGNKEDIQKVLNALETIDGSLMNIYEEKTGQSREQISAWMNEEKWFSADEAVKYGFATKDAKNDAKVLNSAMTEIALTSTVITDIAASALEVGNLVGKEEVMEKRFNNIEANMTAIFSAITALKSQTEAKDVTNETTADTRPKRNKLLMKK